MATNKKVYALLFAVDAYPAGLGLDGCVADSKALKAYLESTIPTPNLVIETLHDEKATKDQIINKFKTHLSKAAKDDVILIHYSGHGSQETAPEELWAIEPDGKIENILPIDGISEDGNLKNPIADKELRYLLANLSNTCNNIVVILDCCHSGSGTRNISKVKSRFSPSKGKPRSITNFIFNDEYEKSGKKFDFLQKQGKHILLGACRSNETAKELPIGNEPRGIFTYSLIQALQSNNAKLSYRDLIAQSNGFIANTVNEQTPQLEAINGANLDAYFLNDIIPEPQYAYTVEYDKTIKNWVVRAGLFQGIQPGLNTSKISIFDATTDINSPTKQILLEAKISEVHGSYSKIDIISGTAVATKTYKAILSGINIAKMRISLEAEIETSKGIEIAKPNDTRLNPEMKSALSLIREALSKSLYVKEAIGTEQPDYRVVAYKEAGKRKYRINKLGSDFPLTMQLEGFNKDTAAKVVNRQLDHIARWKQTYDFKNPQATELQKQVSYQVIDENGNELIPDNSGGLSLMYTYDADATESEKFKAPGFKLKISYKGKQRIFASIIILSTLYGVDTEYCFPSGVVSLGDQPSEDGDIINVSETYADAGNFIYEAIPQELLDLGVIEIKQTYKLIVSTADFSANLATMKQKDLEAAKGLRAPTKAPTKKTTAPSEEWFTKQITFNISYPLILNTASLQSRGIEIEAPQGLNANYQLSSISQAQQSTRTIRGTNTKEKIIPPALMDYPEQSEPISLISNRSIGGGNLNLLELQNANTAAVSKSKPLKIKLPLTLQNNEYILPVASDGEFFYPLGISEPSENGKTQVNINFLPNEGTTSSGKIAKRGFGKTVKILFQKMIGDKIAGIIGQDKVDALNNPLLSNNFSKLYLVNGEEKEKWNATGLAVANKISTCNKIVVVMHGFTGETKDLLFSKKDNNLHQLLSKYYDAVLAFDYDGYSTSIEQNSKDLLALLSKIGLASNNSKELHVIAHSMGGLVTRYAIESELGGASVISKLIMVGTPNEGSPWPKIKDWAMMGMGLLLNQIPVVGWPLTALNFVIQKTHWVTNKDQVSEDMQYKSEFLTTLNNSADPKIPYIIVTGNTQLVKTEKTKGFVQNMLAKLNLSNPQYKILDLLFGSKNDIAVSVASMEFADVSAKRIPPAKSYTAACNHLNYFGIKEGLDAVELAIKEALTNIESPEI